jgi:hypothetical protein
MRVKKNFEVNNNEQNKEMTTNEVAKIEQNEK